MRRRRSPVNTNRNGVSLALIAVLLPVLILLCGFAINIAQVQLNRTELQCATDASARAAGRTFSSSRDRTAALADANRIAASNAVAGQPLVFRDEDLEIGIATRNGVGARYDFSPFDESDANAVRLQGLKTADSPNGSINCLFPVFGTKSIDLSKVAVSAQPEVDVVLVIDRSGSMAYADDEVALFPPAPAAASAGWTFASAVPEGARWLDAVDATEAFLEALEDTPQLEKVGLVTYADSSTADVELTSEYSQITQGLDLYTNSLGGGGTHITSGLNEARAMLNDRSPRDFAIKVIVLMTDGRHNLGQTPGTTANQITGDGISIFTVTFSEEADQGAMQETADAGNGQQFHAQSREDLIMVFSEIGKSLPTLLTQ